MTVPGTYYLHGNILDSLNISFVRVRGRKEEGKVTLRDRNCERREGHYHHIIALLVCVEKRRTFPLPLSSAMFREEKNIS